MKSITKETVLFTYGKDGAQEQTVAGLLEIFDENIIALEDLLFKMVEEGSEYCDELQEISFDGLSYLKKALDIEE